MPRRVLVLVLVLAATAGCVEPSPPRGPPGSQSDQPAQAEPLDAGLGLPDGASDPSCGPAVLSPPGPGRFPGPCLTWSDAGYSSHTYTYDAMGRLTSERGPDSSSRSWTYDSAGRLRDLAGCGPTCCVESTWTYDDGGQLAESTERPCHTNTIVTTYEYDALGHLVAEHLDNHNGFQADVILELDAAGRPIHSVEARPDGGVLELNDWTYDDAGLSGHVQTEAWGPVLRERFVAGLLVESHLDSQAGVQDAAYSYCGNGLVHEERHANWLRLGAADAGELTTSQQVYTYGEFGFWVSQDVIYGDRRQHIARTLDPFGNIIEETTTGTTGGDAFVVHYDYGCFGP